MKERTFTPPFFIQMSSGEHNLHCDKFPHGSIHEVKKCLEEDNLWVTKSKLDFIPKNFKTIVVENKPETKICEGCKNEFSKDWIFVKYKTPESENKEMCVRCYEKICETLKGMGFASNNFLIGVGSMSFVLYQTRDSLMQALKGTACIIDGKLVEIFKDPKTDNGTKKSAKGLIAVYKDENGAFYMKDQATVEQANDCELKPVYKDGKLLIDHSLSDIRKRMHSF